MLFLILRLACEAGIELPAEVEATGGQSVRATDLVLDLCARFARLLDQQVGTDPAAELEGMLQVLAALAEQLGVNLARAHELEMRVALQFFRASGDRWPHPQPLRRPLATLRLLRLLRQRGFLPSG